MPYKGSGFTTSNSKPNSRIYKICKERNPVFEVVPHYLHNSSRMLNDCHLWAEEHFRCAI